MSLDARLEAVKTALLGQMEESKNVVFGGLVENAQVNPLPESIFVNYFLPCFIGRAENPNWVMEWIGIAGTPMAKVAVVRDGTNEVLFQVPALLHTNNLVLSGQQTDFGSIFSRFTQISNNLPVNGLRFLNEALASKNGEILSATSMDEVGVQWLQILHRYNLVNVQVPQAVQADRGDYFEY